MAFAVPKRGFDLQPTGKSSKRVEKPAYLDFIRSLPCIVTRREGVEAAHISYSEREYWRSVGIDPVPIAAFIHAAYPSRERALLIINNIVRGSAFEPKPDISTGEVR